MNENAKRLVIKSVRLNQHAQVEQLDIEHANITAEELGEFIATLNAAISNPPKTSERVLAVMGISRD